MELELITLRVNVNSDAYLFTCLGFRTKHKLEYQFGTLVDSKSAASFTVRFLEILQESFLGTACCTVWHHCVCMLCVNDFVRRFCPYPVFDVGGLGSPETARQVLKISLLMLSFSLW